MDNTITTIVAAMSDGSTVTLFPVTSVPTVPTVPVITIPLNTPVEITAA